MSDSWFKVGFNSSAVTSSSDPKSVMKGWSPRRFWVEADSSKDFIFVSEDPFCIREHNPKINGSWDNHLTCLRGTGEDCPACEIMGDKSAYYVGYYTVIDCSEWVDKKGNKHQYEMRLLPAKTKTLKKFARKKEQRGTLIGAKFISTREDKKSPNVGDEFEFKEQVELATMVDIVNLWGVNLSKLYEVADSSKEDMEKLRNVLDLTLNKGKTVKDKVPNFNYFKLFQPKSTLEIKTLLKDFVPEDAPADSGSKVEEETPF